MNRYEELVSEYLDDSLDNAGRSELVSLVKRDPDRLGELVDLVRDSRILSTEFQENPAEAFTRRVIADLEKDRTRFIRGVMADVRRGGARPSSRPRRLNRPGGGGGSRWMTWGVMAAGAAIFLGVLALVVSGGGDARPHPMTRFERREPATAAVERKGDPADRAPKADLPAVPMAEGHRFTPEDPVPQKIETPPSPERLDEKRSVPEPRPDSLERKSREAPTVVEVATLEHAEGRVTLGKVSAQSGQALIAGFDVETADEKSTAALRYPDGTRLELRGSSRLHDVSDRSGRRVYVEGTLASEIPKLPADQPMIFVTLHAEAKIVGTKIRIETDAESTRLDVTEGRVKFTRLKDKTSVEVTAGHTAVAASNVPLASKITRAGTGLVALYTFKEGRGALIHDVSRAGAPIDLKIENEKTVRWSPKGLMLAAPTMVVSMTGASRIAQACAETNELSLEAWLRPATVAPLAKDGRILTLSADYMNQDFMLGQDQVEGPSRSYFVRLRTTTTDLVGKPALASPEGAATPKLTHVVYTRSASGVAVLYVDGAEVSRSIVDGNFSSWNEGYRLGLGNEFTHDRPWLGEYRLVAVYSRAVNADEVKQNLRAGTE